MSSPNDTFHSEKVRELMGNQELETKPNDEQAISTYSIVSYPAKHLPDAYRNMIFSKWQRSLRFGNDYFKLIDSDAYFSAYQRLITLILNKPETVVKLAVLTEDQDVVFGFSVFRGNTLDYIHVHKDVRKQGIATSLYPKDTDTITHLTTIGMAIWTAKIPTVLFNPFKE